MNPNLILGLSCALISDIFPPVGVIGLAEYICTHPILTSYSRRSRLHPRRHQVGFRPAPSLAYGQGHRRSSAWRKTLMTLFS
jgi:hypothetical protein